MSITTEPGRRTITLVLEPSGEINRGWYVDQTVIDFGDGHIETRASAAFNVTEDTLSGLMPDAAAATAQIVRQNDEIAAANALASERQTQLDAANTTITGLQAQVTTANSTIASMQGQIDAANATIADLQAQIGQAPAPETA